MVGFRRAKNESSSHRQGVRVGTGKEGFRRSSKRRDFGKSNLSGLGGFLPVYQASKGKRFFLPWLNFHLWAGKRGFFLVKGLFGKEKKWDFLGVV